LSYVQVKAPETEFELHCVCVLRKPSNVFVTMTPSDVVRAAIWSVDTPLGFVTYW
jgi:hypothetical protein